MWWVWPTTYVASLCCACCAGTRAVTTSSLQMRVMPVTGLVSSSEAEAFFCPHPYRRRFSAHIPTVGTLLPTSLQWGYIPGGCSTWEVIPCATKSAAATDSRGTESAMPCNIAELCCPRLMDAACRMPPKCALSCARLSHGPTTPSLTAPGSHVKLDSGPRECPDEAGQLPASSWWWNEGGGG